MAKGGEIHGLKKTTHFSENRVIETFVDSTIAVAFKKPAAVWSTCRERLARQIGQGKGASPPVSENWGIFLRLLSISQ